MGCWQNGCSHEQAGFTILGESFVLGPSKAAQHSLVFGTKLARTELAAQEYNLGMFQSHSSTIDSQGAPAKGYQAFIIDQLAYRQHLWAGRHTRPSPFHPQRHCA